MQKYIFNNYYSLHHDLKRTFILTNDSERIDPKVPVSNRWKSVIHPIYAMMLAFFSTPVTKQDAICKIASFFEISENEVSSFINALINSAEPSHTNYEGHENGFPLNIVDSENETHTRHIYKPIDFVFNEFDPLTRRMFTAPLTIVFMPNNNCYTQCLYCYADTKTRKGALSEEEIINFINDASKNRVREILLTGGDFFMHYNWKRILTILISHGFTPDMISTKKPLPIEDIAFLSPLGIRLQISLDSMNDTICQNLLSVNEDYVSKIKDSLICINNSNIPFQVSTVLTRLNDAIEELEKLRSFLSNLNNLRHWEIRVAFKSLYSKSNFNDIKSARKQIAKIENWISEKKESFHTRLLWSPDEDANYKNSTGGSMYFDGPLCSANMTNMVILPNGDVTICEQLYWNKDFLIGNIKEQSIAEIWNSQKALSLWNRSQDSIKKESPCHTCKAFSDCFKYANRCYANIIKAYGFDNFDYPDPRCRLAPTFNNSITHE